MQELINKNFTVICLAIITITEILCCHTAGTMLLWILYGLYKIQE